MNERALPLKAKQPARVKKMAKKLREWDVDSFGSTLFEQTGECVFIIGIDLHYLAANRQALVLLGYDANEFVGMSVRDVMSMEEVPERPQASAEQVHIYERILRRKDGILVPVEISTSLVTDESGEPAYIQSIARDITDRKAAEKLLRRNGRILSVISEATARLFRSPNIQSRISEMLESLGLALETFCCVIFEIDGFGAGPQIRISISQPPSSHTWRRSIHPRRQFFR